MRRAARSLRGRDRGSDCVVREPHVPFPSATVAPRCPCWPSTLTRCPSLPLHAYCPFLSKSCPLFPSLPPAPPCPSLPLHAHCPFLSKSCPLFPSLPPAPPCPSLPLHAHCPFLSKSCPLFPSLPPAPPCPCRPSTAMLCLTTCTFLRAISAVSLPHSYPLPLPPPRIAVPPCPCWPSIAMPSLPHSNPYSFSS